MLHPLSTCDCRFCIHCFVYPVVPRLLLGIEAPGLTPHSVGLFFVFFFPFIFYFLLFFFLLPIFFFLFSVLCFLYPLGSAEFEVLSSRDPTLLTLPECLAGF